MLRTVVVLVALMCCSTAWAVPDSSGTDTWVTGGGPASSATVTTTVTVTSDVVLNQPGWWERTFWGADQNGDGEIMGGERGILLIAWDWIVATLRDAGNTFIQLLWNAMPTTWQTGISSNLSVCRPYLAAAEAWAPVSYTLSMVVGYYTFLAVFVTVKFILKLIPTIG